MLDIIPLGRVHVVYMGRTASFLRVLDAMWTELDPVTLLLHFLNQFLIAATLLCSFWETMAGSLFVASTALSSIIVSVVDSDVVGRSAVYSKYNNDPLALPK
jgi:uncharacterized membrane protein YhhN